MTKDGQLAEDAPCPHDVTALCGLRDDWQYIECLACGHRDYSSVLNIAARKMPE